MREFYTTEDFTATAKTQKKIEGLENHPLLNSLFDSIEPYFQLKEKLPERIISLKIEETLTVLRSLDQEMDSILTDFSNPDKISVEDFMEQNYLFNLPIDKFAYLTGRSLTTFKRDFKKAYSTSPQKWLTQKRLDFAYHQIARKQRKPSEVYLETGFENLSHFSHVFKKRFGSPPSNVLKQKACR